MRQKGFNTLSTQSQIIPVMVGNNETVLTFSKRLENEGILAVAIRPPSVPTNTARLRISVTAAHRQEDLQWAISRITSVGRELGVVE
nr:aminotransferase class I/II-fold pyridoxal phosphate-dependent enzyme [Heliobacterium chlorum]